MCYRPLLIRIPEFTPKVILLFLRIILLNLIFHFMLLKYCLYIKYQGLSQRRYQTHFWKEEKQIICHSSSFLSSSSTLAVALTLCYRWQQTTFRTRYPGYSEWAKGEKNRQEQNPLKTWSSQCLVKEKNFLKAWLIIF